MTEYIARGKVRKGGVYEKERKKGGGEGKKEDRQVGKGKG